MKLFVWDFHGVLEKDNEYAVIEVSNLILKKHGYKQRFNAKDRDQLYGLKWYRYFAHLLPDEPEEVHFKLQRACVEYEEYFPQVVEKYIKPGKYAHRVLSAVSKIHDQILISNVSDIALGRFMKSVRVDKFFPNGKAFATNSHKKISTYTKADFLKRYLKGRRYQEIIIIGDRPHDMEMKQVAGGTTYLYAHPHREHPQAEADYKINDLREILKEI